MTIKYTHEAEKQGFKSFFHLEKEDVKVSMIPQESITIPPASSSKELDVKKLIEDSKVIGVSVERIVSYPVNNVWNKCMGCHEDYDMIPNPYQCPKCWYPYNEKREFR